MINKMCTSIATKPKPLTCHAQHPHQGSQQTQVAHGPSGKTTVTTGGGDDKVHFHYNADGSGTLWANGEKHELPACQMQNVVIKTGDGNDKVSVTGNPDINAKLSIDTGKGDDIVRGGNGAETIYTGKGNDQVFGGGGDDNIHGGSGSDHVDGGAGNDKVDGGRGCDTVVGGDGNDELHGGRGKYDDVVYGGAGNDTVSANRGNDTIYGGAGDDHLRGGSGNDKIYGGSGNDFLEGHKGRDILVGGSGNDRLDGGKGRDQLFGGTGIDTLNGSATVAQGGDHIDFGTQQNEPVDKPFPYIYRPMPESFYADHSSCHPGPQFRSQANELDASTPAAPSTD